MSSEPIDLEKERNKRLPVSTFYNLPEELDPHQWLCRLVDCDGNAIVGRTGLDFGFEGMPGITITAAQARAFARVLVVVADHLDAEVEAAK